MDVGRCTGGVDAYTVNGVPLSTLPVTPIGRAGALLALLMHLRAVLDELLMRVPLHSAADTAAFQRDVDAVVARLPADAAVRSVVCGVDSEEKSEESASESKAAADGESRLTSFWGHAREPWRHALPRLFAETSALCMN